MQTLRSSNGDVVVNRPAQPTDQVTMTLRSGREMSVREGFVVEENGKYVDANREAQYAIADELTRVEQAQKVSWPSEVRRCDGERCRGNLRSNDG